MKVAIAGASGLTGSLCLQHLLASRDITQVISIGRKFSGISHPKLSEVLLINNLLEQEVAADAFISCLGTTIKKAGSKDMFRAIDFRLPVYIAAQLHYKGCRTITVMSALGADTSSALFYSKTKGEMEDAVKRLHFESTSFFRPSFIEGDRKEKRLGEKLFLTVLKISSPLLQGKLKKYRPVKASEIASALVNSVIAATPGVSIYEYNEIKAFAY